MLSEDGFAMALFAGLLAAVGGTALLVKGSTRGEHAHKCGRCNSVWIHDPPIDMSDDDYKKAHTCSQCGEEQYWKHYGD